MAAAAAVPPAGRKTPVTKTKKVTKIQLLVCCHLHGGKPCKYNNQQLNFVIKSKRIISINVQEATFSDIFRLSY